MPNLSEGSQGDRTRNSPTEAGLLEERECDDPGVQVPSASTTFSRGEVERFGRRRSRRARGGGPGDGRLDVQKTQSHMQAATLKTVSNVVFTIGYGDPPGATYAPRRPLPM